MSLSYERECPRGHFIHDDDPSWCTTCEDTIYGIWDELMDATGSGPFPQDAMWHTKRLRSLVRELHYSSS
jgi:hypothetical protein